MKPEWASGGVGRAIGYSCALHLCVVAGMLIVRAAPTVPGAQPVVRFEMVALPVPVEPVSTPSSASPASDPAPEPEPPAPEPDPPAPEPKAVMPLPRKPPAVKEPAKSPTAVRPLKPRSATPVAIPAAPVSPDRVERTVLPSSSPGEAAPPVERYQPPDLRAAYASNPAPRYPPFARRSGQEGTVLLSVVVTASGTVEQVTVQQGSGHALLDRAAVESVSGWRFVPAQRQGHPVAATVTVPIRFQLRQE